MKANSRRCRVIGPAAALVATLAALAMYACGGSSYHEHVPATYVTGVAATGAPIANATVTLKDGRGRSASARTASDGSFRIKATRLTPPYLVQVAAPGGNLYSVSADALRTTTINVTTLTDLATRAWFTVYGTSSLDAVFADPTGVAFPRPTQINEVEKLIDGVFALWLDDAGVDASVNNLISTPFEADGSGLDQVLEQTSVDEWLIEITGAVPAQGSAKPGALPATMGSPGPVERTQVTILSFDSSENTVTVESEVKTGTEVSTTVATTVVPTTTAMESAFEQIDATIGAVAQLANQKGQSLTVSDVLPFIDPAHMGQGLNQVETADLFVAQVKMSSGTLGGYLISLDELDTVNGTAHGYYTFTETLNGQTATNRQESRFRLVDGKWLLSGDGRPGYMYVKTQTFTDQGNSSIQIEATASTREGAYTASTVTGGGWVDLVMSAEDATTVDEAGHRFRGFLYREDIAAGELPPAGTPFSFELQPASGPQEAYVVKTNAATDALVWITSAPDGAAPDIIGRRVTLAWTLPTTVVIDEVNLQGMAHAGVPEDVGTVCDIWGDVLGRTATSGSIDIPTTCDGRTVIWVELFVNVEGVNGEEMSAYRPYH